MSDPKWLDSPDGDGWWWFLNTSLNAPVIMKVERVGDTLRANGRAIVQAQHIRWQRVAPHTPIPVPLPRSRTVELTARVRRFGCTPGWRADAEMLGIVAWTAVEDTREEAIERVRERFGIEPEVPE